MKLQYIIYGMIVYALIGFSSIYAQADRQSRNIHQQEMQSYVENHVLPVVNPQRDKLDAILSLADRQEVADIRTDLQSMRENRPKRQHKKGETPSAEQKEEFRAMMKTRRLLMTRAWAVADKYETEIAQLLDEIEPHAKTWKEEIRKIKETHRSTKPTNDEGHSREHRKGHRDHSGEHGPRGHHAPRHRKGGMMGMGSLKGMHSPVGFLLWDTSASPFERMPQEDIRTFSVYPNPSTGHATISYELPESGNVQIQIADAQGNVVKSTVHKDKKAGQYTEQLSVQELKKGVYFIQIRSENEVQTQKLVVE